MRKRADIECETKKKQGQRVCICEKERLSKGWQKRKQGKRYCKGEKEKLVKCETLRQQEKRVC